MIPALILALVVLAAAIVLETLAAVLRDLGNAMDENLLVDPSEPYGADGEPRLS